MKHTIFALAFVLTKDLFLSYLCSWRTIDVLISLQVIIMLLYFKDTRAVNRVVGH